MSPAPSTSARTGRCPCPSCSTTWPPTPGCGGWPPCSNGSNRPVPKPEGSLREPAARAGYDHGRNLHLAGQAAALGGGSREPTSSRGTVRTDGGRDGRGGAGLLLLAAVAPPHQA